ncbi:unnamed protein product [Adineta ricciae]|uniref:Helix-turn-helix domain-containing protein n=1 Tax=Adineta ricciae TaxID=249248 RepID=A0A815XLV2_ADIRI|nr:unnamed protein product [Adineta ricciae]CAF1559184.1 unnamed protein product [Adineta ricciae]
MTQAGSTRVKIETTISTSVHFLDITITNDNGQLRTSIYHKPTAEPYVLPLTSDHPRHVHRNIPYELLLRAARICSHINDFNTERIRIDMSLLLNDYPPNFIAKHFNRFFQLNQARSVVQQLDENSYQRLHQQLLFKPTRREKQLQQHMQDPINKPLALETKEWNRKIMATPYIFDSGLTKDFRSNVNNVRVRLIPTTNRTLEDFFIHKKPRRQLLTRMDL